MLRALRDGWEAFYDSLLRHVAGRCLKRLAKSAAVDERTRHGAVLAVCYDSPLRDAPRNCRLTTFILDTRADFDGEFPQLAEEAAVHLLWTHVLDRELPEELDLPALAHITEQTKSEDPQIGFRKDD